MSAYTAAVLADSPISYWRLGEASGTAAADQQGVNAGTYTGTVTLGATGALTTSGDTDTAVTLNGVNGNYVLAKTSAILGGLANATMEAWVKTTQTSGIGGACIYAERNAAGGVNDILKMEQIASGTTLQLTYRDDAGTLNQIHGATAINNGAWHHVVITKSGTAITLYVDGASDGSGVLSASNTFTNVLRCQIGEDANDTTSAWNGSLDEVAVYNTALSAARVLAHYQAATTPPPPPPTATTNPASSITATSATLNGNVNPNGSDATVHFEWGTTTGYGTSTANQDAGLGSSGVPMSAGITGLVNGTTYHFRVVAVNSSGTTNGLDQSFVAQAQPAIALAPPLLTRAQWEFILCDSTGNPLAELSTASGRTIALKRNSYTEVQFSISHEDDAAALLLSALATTGVPRLKCYRRGVNDSLTVGAPLRFRGYMAALSEVSEETSLLTATFRSPFGMLVGDGDKTGRFVQGQFPLIYSATDAGLIAKALIDLANSVSSTALATDPTLITATKLRDRTYPPGQNIGAAVQDLTGVLDGFDFYESFIDGVGVTGAFFNVVPSLGIVNQGVRFEYGPATLSNVRSLTRTTTPPQNSIFVTGGNGLTSTYQDTTSVTKYGEWWSKADFSSIIEQATLSDKAKGLVRPNPVKTVAFVPDLALSGVPYDDWNLGDTVTLYASRSALTENTQIRINGFTIPISDDGYETAEIQDPTLPEEDAMIRASLVAEVLDGG